MMLGGSAKAYVCAEPVDMRKSIDGLAQLVAPLLRGDAFSGGQPVLGVLSSDGFCATTLKDVFTA